MGCCFRVCALEAKTSTLRIKVWPPSDQEPVALEGHLVCFESCRKAAVSPDVPKEFGRIPSRARCVFCGDRLPIIGDHPYALEVETESGSMRFWAHSDCFPAHIVVPQEWA